MTADIESTELTEQELALASSGDPHFSIQDKDRDGAGSTEDSSEEPVGGDEPSAAEEVGTPVKDEADSPDSGKDAAEPASPAWITDDHRELAKSYGFSDADLSEFTSDAEFRRAARHIDRQLAAPFQPPPKPPEPPPAAPEVATVAKSGQPVELDPEKLRADGYDDEIINFAKAAKEERERFAAERRQFEEFKQAAQRAEVQRVQDTIDSTFDRMDEGRYGRRTNKDGTPRQLTAHEVANRSKAQQEAETIAAGIVARYGNNAPQISLDAMLRRGDNVAFADDIRNQERQRMAKQIAEQSKRRRPVAGHKQPRTAGGQFAAANGRSLPIRDMAAQLASSPEIVKAWSRANGSE